MDVCGDGRIIKRNFDSYCDDGNALDNDGCSATCETEENYLCSGGSHYQPDFCSNIIPLLATASFPHLKDTEILISFNKELNTTNITTLDELKDYIQMDILDFN